MGVYTPVLAHAAAPEHPSAGQAGPEGGCAAGQGQRVTLAAGVVRRRRRHEALREPGGRQGPPPLHRDAPVEHRVPLASRGWAAHGGWDACGEGQKQNTEGGFGASGARRSVFVVAVCQFISVWFGSVSVYQSRTSLC